MTVEFAELTAFIDTKTTFFTPDHEVTQHNPKDSLKHHVTSLFEFLTPATVMLGVTVMAAAFDAMLIYNAISYCLHGEDSLPHVSHYE